MVDDSHDTEVAGQPPALDETQLFFRDTLVSLLRGAIPTLMILAGFLLSGNETRFSIQACCDAGYDPNLRDLHCDKAIGLILISTLMLSVWSFLLFRLRKRLPDHPTIPGLKALALAVGASAVALFVMVYLAVT